MCKAKSLSGVRRLAGVVMLLMMTIPPEAVSQPESVSRYPVSSVSTALVQQTQLPVNASSGQMRFRIPLHTVKAGGMEWPVALEYSGNGLRLEQPPSEVGMGWNLSAGGAVIREVRGLPDEHPRGYWGTQARRQYVQGGYSISDMPLQVLQDFSAGNYDAEPDRFIVSAGPLSFTFYVTSVECPSCELSAQRISVTPDPGLSRIRFQWDEMEITDAAGIRYLFRDRETTRFTSANPALADQMSEYPSAWHLSRITLVNGETIQFQYGSAATRQTAYHELYNRTASPAGERKVIDCAVMGGLYNTGIRQELVVRDLAHINTWQTTDVQSLYIIGMEWPDGKLIFRRGLANGAVPPVEGVELQRPDGSRVVYTSLQYEQQARRLLQRVITDSVRVHSFAYHPISIPHILPPEERGSSVAANPYAQDWWGFANGKPNVTGIPFLGADRQPDFQTAQQGALREITWPTGGTTTISYGPNRYRISAAELDDLEPVAANRQHAFSWRASAGERRQESVAVTFQRLTYARIAHQAFVRGGSSLISFSMEPQGDCALRICRDAYQYSETQRALDPLTAPRFSPMVGVSVTGDVIQSGCGDYYNACNRNSTSEWIRIEPGTYQLTAQLEAEAAADFSITIDYYDPDPEGKNPAWFAQEAGGIRIEETKDCAGDGTPCQRKIYRYTGEDGFSSGRLLGKIDLEYPFQVYDAADCRDYQAAQQAGITATPMLQEWNYPAVSYQFRSLSPLRLSGGSPVAYTRVEISDDEAASNGIEVVHFMVSGRGQSGQYPYVPSSPDPVDGFAWRKEYRIAGTGEKVMQMDQDVVSRALPYPYEIPRGLLLGRRAEYRYTPPSGAEQQLRNSFIYQPYLPEPARKVLLLKKSERQNDGTYVLSKSYKYNSRLQLAGDSTNTSAGGILQTSWLYPPDVSDPAYASLTAANRIQDPVRTEYRTDGVLRKVRQTYYRQWQTSAATLMPERIEVTSDGQRFNEHVTLSVTKDGAPAETLDVNGLRTVMIYGAHERDVMAIVNGALRNEVYVNTFESGPFSGRSAAGDSRTGLYSATNGFSITLTGLTAGRNYRLIWWQKSAGLWSMQSKAITALPTSTYTITLTGQVDDIRFHPAGALVTTFTSDPFAGITSETDANGLTAFSEYDALGRLTIKRDHQRNILQRFQYRLQQQLNDSSK